MKQQTLGILEISNFTQRKISMELILIVLTAFSQYLFLTEGKIQIYYLYDLWTVWKVYR